MRVRYDASCRRAKEAVFTLLPTPSYSASGIAMETYPIGADSRHALPELIGTHHLRFLLQPQAQQHFVAAVVVAV